jgi:hypothetical protein
MNEIRVWFDHKWNAKQALGGCELLYTHARAHKLLLVWCEPTIKICLVLFGMALVFLKMALEAVCLVKRLLQWRYSFFLNYFVKRGPAGEAVPSYDFQLILPSVSRKQFYQVLRKWSCWNEVCSKLFNKLALMQQHAFYVHNNSTNAFLTCMSRNAILSLQHQC